MEVNKFIVEGKFGIQLSCISVLPEGEVKAAIHILHGMGEHKKRYLPFMKWMAKLGYAMFAHDHRKHGESIGEFDSLGVFTDADRWEYVVDDAHYVAREIKKQLPGVKLITMGHSMGSMIARRYISKYAQTPHAAIIMGTLPIIKGGKAFLPLEMAKIIRLFKKDKLSPFMAEQLNKPLMKTFKEARTQYDWLSTDEKQVDKYIADPLCGHQYSAKFYIEFFKGLVKANKTIVLEETRNIPILFISGKDDPVGEFGDGVDDVREFYNGHGFFLLSIKLIDGMRHEVLNEKKKTTTYKMIEEWVSSIL